MNTEQNKSLESLGFDSFFHNSFSNLNNGEFSPARITEVNKGSFRVSDGTHEMPAELSGRFMFTADEISDYPTTGDWVLIQLLDNSSMAVIHDVFPRKTLLKRKAPGKKVDFQLIASNIDFGLVVQSADALNLNSLERYLVMLNESRIEPIIVISKIDLLSPSELVEIQKLLIRLGSRYLLVSNVTSAGIEPLSNELQPCRTYCLLGSSGVGKTSLLNKLSGEELLRVNEVREKDGKGRHTTVRRQLIRLQSGSIFIDTPGMRELGNLEVASGIEQTFDEIAVLGTKCQFKDCTHIHEKGCAVIEALEQGNIDPDRYKNYLKLKKESDYHEMSYLEKRKKERTFGKIIKNYKKMKREN